VQQLLSQRFRRAAKGHPQDDVSLQRQGLHEPRAQETPQLQHFWKGNSFRDSADALTCRARANRAGRTQQDAYPNRVGLRREGLGKVESPSSRGFGAVCGRACAVCRVGAAELAFPSTIRATRSPSSASCIYPPLEQRPCAMTTAPDRMCLVCDRSIAVTQAQSPCRLRAGSMHTTREQSSDTAKFAACNGVQQGGGH